MSAFYRKIVALAQINALQSALQMSKMARAIKEMKKKKMPQPSQIGTVCLDLLKALLEESTNGSLIVLVPKDVCFLSVL